MRLASYNFQNLFDRPKVMNRESWTQDESADGSLAGRFAGAREILNLYSELTRIFAKPIYQAGDREQIRAGLLALGLERGDESRFVRLRQNKGRLVRRPRDGGIVVVAGGRGDWVGWLELEREAVDEVATQNTARVLKEIDADIVAAIEVEDRIPLLRFNEQVLPNVDYGPYDHVMAINGNDERGIDVGIMSRSYPIEAICSHVDDRDGDGNRIFSRDCAQYRVTTTAGPLWILVNHFKSKGFGDFEASERRRAAQAARVREIYLSLVNEGQDLVAVVGDLNDLKDSWPLAALFQGTDLRDVSDHPAYVETDGRRGTFGNCSASDHIDFILLSPALFDRVERTSVFRKGIWGGTNGTLFPHFDTISKPSEAASDHAAIWADLAL